ncbi:putative transcription factor MYB-HB-like family [Helianthus anomalus]
MELFPQSNQGGVFNGHDNRKSTSLISTDEEETISQEVVIISDDASEDPTRTKEGGDRDNIRRRRRSVSRRRWTLLEDCKLVEVVASHKQKFVWKTIAAGFPQRTSNSCRLRWIKMFKPEDTLFTENRWSEMAMLMGDRVINQWRLMIAHNIPEFYTSISANHPLKRSSVQNAVAPMINGPYVGKSL